MVIRDPLKSIDFTSSLTGLVIGLNLFCSCIGLVVQIFAQHFQTLLTLRFPRDQHVREMMPSRAENRTMVFRISALVGCSTWASQNFLYKSGHLAEPAEFSMKSLNSSFNLSPVCKCSSVRKCKRFRSKDYQSFLL